MGQKQRAFSPHAYFEMRSLIFYGKSAIFLSKSTVHALSFCRMAAFGSESAGNIFYKVRHECQVSP